MLQTGLDILLSEQLALLHGRRVGQVTHPAAVLPDLTGAADALLRAGVRLTALFGPEHGVSGAAGAGDTVDNAVDARTGLPVFSLYGSSVEPTAEMLSDVDVLLFDMQDVGVRFYTYLSTLFYVLRGAAKAHKPAIVLDRPNPIGGQIVEGPSIEPGFESFVGIMALPIRHGLTLGEAALLMSTTFDLDVELAVVEMRGWRRDYWFDQTGRAWVPTSPAMPHVSTATVYPGTCLLEGTNVSVGRGTALPFEICGAPWLAGAALAERMNALNLAGARFRPLHFCPSADRYAGQECGGVQVHITDRAALRPVMLGLHLVAAIRSLHPREFAWAAAHFDRLLGGARTREAIETDAPVETFAGDWDVVCAQFEQGRQPYLRYS
jgi:uncharacterized protein YbbC (DUF1343 family)